MCIPQKKDMDLLFQTALDYHISLFYSFFYNRENFLRILTIYYMKGKKANQKINRKED